MSGRIRVTGARPADIAAAFDAAADDLREQVADVERGIGDRVRDEFPGEARATLPRRGGLADRVAGSTIDVQLDAGGARPTLTVEASNARVDLGPVNAGTIRHPTYGGRPWVAQEVRPGVWDRTVERALDPADDDLDDAVRDVMTTAATRAGS